MESRAEHKRRKDSGNREKERRASGTYITNRVLIFFRARGINQSIIISKIQPISFFFSRSKTYIHPSPKTIRLPDNTHPLITHPLHSLPSLPLHRKNVKTISSSQSSQIHTHTYPHMQIKPKPQIQILHCLLNPIQSEPSLSFAPSIPFHSIS